MIKCMGNPQGSVALSAELIGTELAALVGLPVADFAIMDMPEIVQGIPFAMQAGPAFCSKWVEDSVTLSPDSRLLSELRRVEDISLLVVFDTWIRNTDRYQGASSSNRDNLLFVPDKRKVGFLAIDHTHAFIEIDFSTELDDGWVEEQRPYGVFPQFVEHLSRRHILNSIVTINSIDRTALEEILANVPHAWGMSSADRNQLIACLLKRANRLDQWLPDMLIDQVEMDF